MTAHPQIKRSNNFIHIGEEQVGVIFEPTMLETIHVINVLHWPRDLLFTGVHVSEVKMGESIKVSYFFNDKIHMDITYLVRYHLQLCTYVTVQWIVRLFFAQYIQNVQGLFSISIFIDSKQRSTGGLRPLQRQGKGADFALGDHQQRNVAIIPHHRLLPSHWPWGGIRLCLGGRWWLVHGLGEAHNSDIAQS